MLIFDKDNEPIILDDADSPVLTDSFWVFDMQILDFTLTQLMVLEEIIAPTAEININGFAFPVPTTWNILVVDTETQMLDLVQVKKVAGKDFNAFTFGPNKSRHEAARISVSNYWPNKHNVGPSLQKHQMLCHPIDQDTWVNISPSDGYNKYLKECVAGDLI